jgi:hypothetical protein
MGVKSLPDASCRREVAAEAGQLTELVERPRRPVGISQSPNGQCHAISLSAIERLGGRKPY